uniref:Uncharacterized protein n=1 Tax=Arundo donax TaxID=35708 RepID=A0A0A9B0A2_ARUDO
MLVFVSLSYVGTLILEAYVIRQAKQEWF